MGEITDKIREQYNLLTMKRAFESVEIGLAQPVKTEVLEAITRTKNAVKEEAANGKLSA